MTVTPRTRGRSYHKSLFLSGLALIGSYLMSGIPNLTVLDERIYENTIMTMIDLHDEIVEGHKIAFVCAEFKSLR